MTDAVVDAAAKMQLADAPVDPNAPKLVLDEETGEMVSKGELKKRLAKRAKKAIKEKNKDDKKNVAATTAAAQDGATPKKQTPKPEEAPIDTQAMFKQGFLNDVYNERPVKPVFTRFPPEPNGFLHIGHAKAIAINFGFAKYHGGNCYLRFDDTNPEAEEEIYFTAIEDTVRWLGFTPYKITYSSDNFQKLYDLAEKLIGLDKAYVCHCNDDEIKLQRGGEKGSSPRFRCKHAEQSVEENLQKFRDMRDGKYKPREAFLRMKQDITDGNPQMWDLAAYRVLDKPHHRTGSQWKIYPTYDFTHCLCDSFEGITHSLCTTEFVLSRVSYEWLNKSLEVYEPMQREYGRLSLSGTVLSKRKLKELVDRKIVRGWDDPRLYTLIAVRRRGVPPGAILEFVNELGVTTSNSIIQIVRFEQTIRRYLERTVPRLMLVLDPVPVVIEDADEFDGSELTVPFSSKNAAMGDHKIKFTKTVYIDRSDFREVDSKDYFRLAPGKTVGLLQAPFPIKATSFTKDETTGKVTEIRAVFDRETKKPKTFIQWVGTDGSRKCEVRVYNQLFKSENPAAAEGGWLSDINPESEVVYPDALIESGFDEVKRRAPWPEAAGESELGKGGPESVRFQAMRVAYFALDKESTDDKIVLNRIVSLKEDKEKN
ncbi:glutaminyl-tRNA synthetase [Neurospora crassa]|uniref:glutamine--tRNA ligase n=3 Tax=Neurospora TaxID=5140 RepID=Q7S9Z2_NEUCR|nr:glutaminyl-tRNA synthetase [Neurospora tetrasperma FGSC 2508]XP_962442.1 glutaminyl-tRNA synthetase [Neurospora crassa OR74A]EGZ72922.1 glutaminyl-tRNA synthetase [Neurospora tetrasperma FGSC 2509]KHE85883.1 glutaminyl-tRNA synthetase [Neurospora crassa]EAA33206.1 glutaminyl-tRNA synthetase [Neurospora crassa OR74A]EGO58820.1 glutaminyl-tRNA synthetase [Neurospora tetrasperma FGSC 2508]|eukprot:XP_962442.1 glutaminyl-tRNA synthetase [Neurospora crassa OR74A]